MKYPSALMQKANELNHHVKELDTYNGDDLNKTKLLRDIIYHAKDLLVEAVKKVSDSDVDYLISGIENMDLDGELDIIINDLEEIEEEELSGYEEHSTMNKNGTGCK